MTLVLVCLLFFIYLCAVETASVRVARTARGRRERLEERRELLRAYRFNQPRRDEWTV